MKYAVTKSNTENAVAAPAAFGSFGEVILSLVKILF